MPEEKKGFQSNDGLVLNFDSSEIDALRGQEKRRDVFLKSVGFIFFQIEYHKERLEQLIHEYDQYRWKQVGKSQRQPQAGMLFVDGRYEKTEELLGFAWNTIDWIERLRKLLGASVGIKQRDEWYQTVMAALKPTTKVRNFLQHIDREQKTLAAGYYTVAGALSAAFKIDSGCYVRLIADERYRHRKDSHLHVPGVKGVPLSIASSPDLITLTVGDQYIELSSVLRAVMSAKKALGLCE